MKKRKELKEFRTATSKRFLNLDGTIQVELFKEPVHFLNENGLYEEINNTLEETPYGVRNKRSDFKVDFNYKNNDNFLEISLNNKKIKMFPKNMNFKKNSKILKKDKISRNVDKIKFEKIQKDTDIEYEIRSKCLKESIILREKPETNIIDFVIQTDLSLQLNDDNSIDLSDNKKKVFKIEKPYMIDKNKAYSENIKYEILENNNYYELKIILDNDWINDKDRAFPVIIDPTVTGIEDTNSVEDTYIFNGDESTTTYNLNKLLVGTDENNVSYRTLLKFNLPVIPTGYRMVNAELYLYSIPEYGNKVLNDKKISIHRINQNWNESTVKWNNINSSFDNKIYDYSVSSNSIYYAENDEIKIDWGGTGANVTQLVQEWYNNPSNNYGMMLKWYDETYSSENEVCEFISSEYLEDSNINSVKPLLSISYKDFNGIENYLTYSTQSHHFGTSNISYYTGNLTTIFNVGNTIGGSLPVDVSFIYNTNDIISNKDYGYGLGIKPNIMQLLKEEQISTTDEIEQTVIYDMLMYIDEDGTTHYFNKSDDNIYYDEDGLSLKVELVDNNYVMTDKEGNINKFILHNNNYYYLHEIINSNNKKIQINYNDNDKITSIIDSTNQIISIEYEENKITVISPHLTTSIVLTDNLITNIVSLGDTEIITYNDNNLIEKITNPNGLAIQYEYLNDLNFKISKVLEIGRNNSIGQCLIFEYNFSDTKITDNKGNFNTYIFNNYGNVVGTTRVENDNNLSKAYGKSYTFGEENGNINKLTTDKSLIKYVNNLIEDSSFESLESMYFVNGDINTTNTTSTACSKSGLKSLSIDIPRGGGYVYKDFLLEKGKYYTFSGYIRGASLVESIENLCLDFILSYNNTQKVTHITEITNEFTRYSVTIYYDEEATDNLRLIMQNVNAEPLSFFLDDIQLEEGEVSNYYNLITNSNFKSEMNTWNVDISNTNDNSNNISTASVVAINGSDKALKIHSTPCDSVLLSKVFNISGKAGDTFNLSFWYKNEGIIPSGYIGLNAGIWANVFFHYGDDFLDGAGIPVENLNVGSNNWQFLSQNFTAEADYENITLQILSSENANDCYLTNFTLFKDLEQYSYIYDENGNLISVHDLNNEIDQIKYDKDNKLSKVITPTGSNFVFEYDNVHRNRIIKAYSPSGVTNTISYDSNGNPNKFVIDNRMTMSDINSEIIYYIRAKGTNKYIYVNSDKTIRMKENECSYDRFYILKDPENKIRIKHSILSNYYIKVVDGEVLLKYGDNNNVFELIHNINGSYSIKCIETNKVLSINDTFKLVLDDYEEERYNQEFYFEQTCNKKYIESKAEYTNDGRFITKIIDSADNETIYDINQINGLTKKVTNSLGINTNYVYDEKLRIVNINTENHSVEYEYINNNVSKIIHGTKNYIINYDDFNNISSIKINDNTLIEKNYSQIDGTLINTRYGNNQTINYEYDSLDRIKRIIKQDDVYENYYDNLGRMVKVLSNFDSYQYDYDFANRLSRYNFNLFEIKYDYDRNNNISKKEETLDNEKNTLNYTFNNDSAITKLNIGDANFNYLYDHLGRIKQTNINDNNIVTYEYVNKGNKTNLLVNKIIDNDTIYDYSYDSLGNITEIKKNSLIKIKYYYDKYNQLIKEENYDKNRIETYEYDNYGNILVHKTYNMETEELETEKNYKFENNNWKDLLTEFNNEAISYDNIGNPVSIGNTNLTWKNGKELATYDNGINNIHYKYNSEGIRTEKNVDNISTKYYLEGNKIIFEKRNNDMIYYIYNNDDLLGFKYCGHIYYFHKNIFDDVIGIFDENYTEIVKYEYDSWGKIINITDNSNINLSSVNPFKYRSYYYDEETKLYYLNSRYYNPEWGRFINCDDNLGSSEIIRSNNLFIYAYNNPITFIDDSGSWPKWVKKAVKAVAVVATVATVATVAVATGGLAAPLVGAATGAVISAGTSALTQTITTGEINPELVILDACSGAITGALGVPNIKLGTSVAINAAASGATYCAGQVLTNQKIDAGDLIINTCSGAISGVISGVNSKGDLKTDINNYKNASQKIRNEIKKMRTNTKYAVKVITREATTKNKIIQNISSNATTDVVSGAAGFAYTCIPDIINKIIRWIKR